MRARRPRFPTLTFCILSAAACACMPATARADVVAARGKPPLVTTQVLRLAKARLVCRADGGGEISFPIEQVDYLQVTGWDLFNLAEKQRRAGELRRAVVSYEKALADLQLESSAKAAAPAEGKSADVLNRVLLLQCRLIPAWDGQGRFERAVELYLEAIEAMPELTDVSRPTHFPEAGSAILELATRQVDAAIERHGEDDVARSLRTWRATWPTRPVASAPAVSEAAGPSTASPVLAWTRKIDEIARLVEAGRYDPALAKAAALKPELHGGLLADLYYWQGRALEARCDAAGAAASAGPASRPERLADAGRAGLAYMRVVVHFPYHARAAECLFRAGRMCRLGGHAQQAAELWNELINAYPQARSPDGGTWADKAREELK